jgi:hypothetical protein
MTGALWHLERGATVRKWRGWGIGTGDGFFVEAILVIAQCNAFNFQRLPPGSLKADR